jgi:cytoskeletal protein CcmA (bactofilin family)
MLKMLKSMKLLTILMCFMTFLTFGQTVKNSSGNWNDGTKWQSGNIGDVITENVSISTNSNTTVIATDNIVVGNVTMVQNNDLTIDALGQLTLGNATNPKTFTTNQNAKINIYGTLTIYGDLIANSNIDIKLYGSGKLIIKGKADFNSNTTIELNNDSRLEIEGDFEGAANNNVTISGTGKASVKGDLTVGCGSNLNGPVGSFTLFGQCGVNGNCNSNFCSSNALPITLLYFKVSKYAEGGAYLEWATTVEKNFEKFTLQRSNDGITFHDMIDIPAKGGNTSIKQTYSHVDASPFNKNYYRLKQVDYDGFTEYSSIVHFVNDANRYFTIYPNPNNGKSLKVFSNYVLNDAGDLKIIDQYGHHIVTYSVAESIDIDLPAGIYYVILNNFKTKLVVY